jgi:hypothetical protein
MESGGETRGFIREAPGPPGLFGVFEDDGETGYLYIYEPEGRGVIRHLHIYDRSAKLSVAEQDVQVKWLSDSLTCGVVICGEMRGAINMSVSDLR